MVPHNLHPHINAPSRSSPTFAAASLTHRTKPLNQSPQHKTPPSPQHHSTSPPYSILLLHKHAPTHPPAHLRRPCSMQNLPSTFPLRNTSTPPSTWTPLIPPPPHHSRLQLFFRHLSSPLQPMQHRHRHQRSRTIHSQAPSAPVASVDPQTIGRGTAAKQRAGDVVGKDTGPGTAARLLEEAL
mmetsp:Transcript_7078/g.19009  ORF Transcript_7078/g.19009 Transcript_7078/m.19009 type:complete len:183 (+) Transcript_7078:478-1026(+)